MRHNGILFCGSNAPQCLHTGCPYRVSLRNTAPTHAPLPERPSFLRFAEYLNACEKNF